MYRKVSLFLLKVFIFLEVIFLFFSTLVPQNLNQELYYKMFSSNIVKYIFLFQLNNYYSSKINFVLLGVIIFLLILSGLKYFKKLSFFLFFMIFFFIVIIIFFDRFYNRRVLINVVEGNSINFSKIINRTKKIDDCYLKFLKFEIKSSEGYKEGIAFFQKGKDTLILSSKKSISIDGYRLYQKEFKKLEIFRIAIDSNDFLCFGDTLYQFGKLRILVNKYINTDKKLLATINNKEIELPLNTDISVDDSRIKFIGYEGEKYLLQIKIVQERFLDFLFILGYLYLFLLLFLLTKGTEARNV